MLAEEDIYVNIDLNSKNRSRNDDGDRNKGMYIKPENKNILVIQSIESRSRREKKNSGDRGNRGYIEESEEKVGERRNTIERTETDPIIPLNTIQQYNINRYIMSLVNVNEEFTWRRILWTLSMISSFITIYSIKEIYGGDIYWCYSNLGSLKFPDYTYSIWWRFITHSFIHNNLYHLLGNIFLFFPLSIVLEYRIGKIWTVVIYIIGVITSSMFIGILSEYGLFSPEYEAVFINGSSGGIHALAGIYIADIIINHNEIRYWGIIAIITGGIICNFIVQISLNVSIWTILIHINGLIFGFSGSIGNRIHDGAVIFFLYIIFIFYSFVIPLIFVDKWFFND